jgi:hypothetical protein
VLVAMILLSFPCRVSSSVSSKHFEDATRCP